MNQSSMQLDFKTSLLCML